MNQNELVIETGKFVQNIAMMKNLYLIIVAITLAACAREVPAPINIIDNIPATAPQLPADVQLDKALYTHRVEISFNGDAAQLSQLPAGVTATATGAFVTLRSSAAGVEYVVRGGTDNGSLVIVSEKSPLVTFDSLDIHSVGCNAVTISSKEKIFLSGSQLFLSDEAGSVLKADKQAATLALMGDAVLCRGLNICLQATRRDALYATGILYVCDAALAVEYATNSAITATRGFVVADGNITATASKDVVKVKQGNFVMLGGNVSLGAVNEKADALAARNIYLFGGAIMADVHGAAAKGFTAKESVFLIGGEAKVHTSGGALFSEKKSDYSSSSCIKSKANVYIKGANVSLASDGDAGKGINCDGLLQIDGGIVAIKTTGNDVNHPIDLNAHASPKGIKCDSTLLINGGKIEVLVLGKGTRCEGVESKGSIIIDGADTKLYIYAYDDAINAGTDFTVNNGTVYAYSVSNDAIDSNGNIRINGGMLLANGSHSPEQGIDTDVEQMFTVTGGTVLSFGGSVGSAPCLPKNGATNVPVAVWSGVNVERNSYINVADADGELLLSYRLPRTMNNAAFMVVSPLIEVGDSYSMFLSENIGEGERLGYGLYAHAVADAPGKEVKWKQKGVLSIMDGRGNVDYINPDTIKQVRGVPPMGPPPAGFPPHGMAGQPPMGPPPAGFPPPPMNGVPPMVPPMPPADSVYDANNLPGLGW